MDDLSNAISQLQNMLSSEEGKKGLEDMIGSLGGQPQENTYAQSPRNNLLTPDKV